MFLYFYPGENTYGIEEEEKRKHYPIGSFLADWIPLKKVDNVLENGSITYLSNGGHSIQINCKAPNKAIETEKEMADHLMNLKTTLKNIGPMVNGRDRALHKILYSFFTHCNYNSDEYNLNTLLFLLETKGYKGNIPKGFNKYFKNGYEVAAFTPLPDLTGDIEADIEEINKKDNEIYTVRCYECNNEVEHYIATAMEVVLRGFKFVKCSHCGKWYFTDTLKQKYCKRESPYPGYTHLKCEQAVRNIKQQLRRKRNRIYNYLYKHRDENDVNSFLQIIAPYFDKLKTEPSITNFHMGDIVCNSYDYLKKEKVKK